MDIFPKYNFIAGQSYMPILPEIEKTISNIIPLIKIDKIKYTEGTWMQLTFINEVQKEKIVTMIQEKFGIGVF